MFNLVLRDLAIHKKYLKRTILYGIPLFIIALFSTEATYNVIPFIYAFSFIQYGIGYGEKNDVDIMLNSLPIKRSNIVFYNYLSIFIFLIVGLAITQLFTIPLKISGLTSINRMMNFQDVVISFVVTVVFNSVYFPFYFKRGCLKSQHIYSIILMVTLGFLIVLNMVIKFINNGTAKEWIINLVNEPNFSFSISIFSIGISIMVLILSMVISMKIYLNREL